MKNQILVGQATQDRKDFLIREIGPEHLLLKSDSIYVESDGPQSDFDLGYALGKEENRERPETIFLNKDYAPLMKQAIEIFEQSSHIEVGNDIQFGEPDECGRVEMTVFPTKGWCLMNIYSQYGQLCAAHDNKTSPVS